MVTASAGSPAMMTAWARPTPAVAIAGCPGASSRLRSASTRWYQRTDSPRIPGRQVCGGQLTGYDLGIRVTGCQLGVAEGGKVPPVFNGRPDQAGFVEALPGLQQQRMTSVRP